jgi:hypothetical protein
VLALQENDPDNYNSIIVVITMMCSSLLSSKKTCSVNLIESKFTFDSEKVNKKRLT